MKQEEQTVDDNSSSRPLANSLKQVRDLVKQMDEAVNQQQRALVAANSTQIKQVALRESGEFTRLLIYMRRRLDELETQALSESSNRFQISALQDLAAAVNSSLELDEVLRKVMDMIVELTKAERAILLLTNEETNQLEVQVARNMDRETIEQSESFQISRSIVRRVAETGEPVATMNAQEDDRFSAQQSIISYRLRSILCVPLKIKDTITGVIYADNRIATGIFNDEDRDMLAVFANQAAVAIENARLFGKVSAQLSEITEMKELMDNIFASIASGVITIDEADRIALYNRAAERILGVPSGEVLNQIYEQVLYALQLPVHSLVQDVKRSGGTYSAEIDVKLRQHTEATTLNLTFSPLRDVDQETLGVAMVLDDVSEKKRLESVRRYLPPALVDQVRDLDAAQRPQRRSITVFFADLRGFSTYSEALDPELLIQILNGYFTEAVQAVTRYQGLTDKFMGDAVMALFNTPLNPQSDHVRRALNTTLMIQNRIESYRTKLPEDQHLYFGVGIHTGEAVVGNVGSDLRKDYSAVGDVVNLAKRLQEVAQPNQILISADTYEQAKSWIVAEALPPMQVKGRQKMETVYDLKGFREIDDTVAG